MYYLHCIPPPEPKPLDVLLPNTLPPVPVLAAPNGVVLLPNPICDRYRCQRTELELELRRDRSISQKNRNGHCGREVVTLVLTMTHLLDASGNVVASTSAITYGRRNFEAPREAMRRTQEEGGVGI